MISQESLILNAQELLFHGLDQVVAVRDMPLVLESIARRLIYVWVRSGLLELFDGASVRERIEARGPSHSGPALVKLVGIRK